MAGGGAAAAMLCILLILAFFDRSESRGPCDPLVPEYCILPFPSSFYTIPAETTTGLQVNFSIDTFPTDVLGRRTDPAEWNTFDGFSPFPSILAYFVDLNDSNLPPHWDISRSLLDTSPTVLLNAKTGQLLPHFAELDNAANQPEKALMIWPSQRLEDDVTYIVALRFLLNGAGPVEPSYAFQSLRDNVSTSNPDIEYRREEFEAMFATLQNAGIARNSLQLAWNFHTASFECLTKRLLFARDDSFERVGDAGPDYTLSQVNDSFSENIFRFIRGYMQVPYYTSTPFPGAHLILDSNGLPVYQGQATAMFTVLVPWSVANGSISQARIVQYGHGLFGTQDEVMDGYLQEQANEHGYLLAACDWWGMAQEDLVAIVPMLSYNISNFRIIPDRLTQGVVNALLLMKMLKGKLAKDPNLTFDGRAIINPELANFYGNSLGGIMGEVYMASTTDVINGVLGVTGGPFGLLLPRSEDFLPYAVGFHVLFDETVEYISIIALANMIWSRLEPNAYMASITQNPLPGTPTHTVLYQYGLGDAQVNLLGLYSVARSAGAVMFESNVREQFYLSDGEIVTESLFGFSFIPDNATVTKGAVAVGFSCGAPPEPTDNIPPNKDFDTHNGPRETKSAQDQMYLFFEYGEIHNLCAGPCQCDTQKN
ncbi:hypothetical protein EMCRGX_G030960 [Ephydatia muelleri]|eukprot:Em0018g1064a